MMLLFRLVPSKASSKSLCFTAVHFCTLSRPKTQTLSQPGQVKFSSMHSSELLKKKTQNKTWRPANSSFQSLCVIVLRKIRYISIFTKNLDYDLCHNHASPLQRAHSAFMKVIRANITEIFRKLSHHIFRNCWLCQVFHKFSLYRVYFPIGLSVEKRLSEWTLHRHFDNI